MMKYYPEIFKISDINKRFPELELVDEDESQRLADIEALKARGKGAPKKAKSKGWHELIESDRLLTTCNTEESRRLARKK
jgi:small subunit ribosomal protein S33